jgi:D-inositol-3-phosphate glycosyltransferase
MDCKNSFDVAIIEPIGGHGGMDYYDLGLCEGVSHAGASVILYTSDETTDSGNKAFMMRKWYVGIFGAQPVVIRGVRFLLATLRVFGDIFKKNIPIVHLHFFGVGVLQLGLIAMAKLVCRKVVVTVHDVESFIADKGSLHLAKIAYSWADSLIVHNQFSKLELIPHLPNPIQSIAVISHGNYLRAYPDRFDLMAARAQLNWPRHERIILFFGQIKGTKRLDLLLEAFAELLTTQPECRLVIAGKVTDVPFDKYQSQIDRFGISNRCTCLIRHIKNEEVPVLYAASDLVVLPYDRIYQSGVLLMAMSFAKAVVVSNIPGMLEIVRDGETGYVFDAGSATALSACLSRALSDMNRLEQIAWRGFQLMKSKFDWDAIGVQHVNLYKLLVDSHRNAS